MLNFIDARMYSQQISRSLMAVEIEFSMPRSRRAIREMVQFGELGLQNPLEKPRLSDLSRLHRSLQRVDLRKSPTTAGGFGYRTPVLTSQRHNAWASTACAFTRY
jgi:hypothetical protein